MTFKLGFKMLILVSECNVRTMESPISLQEFTNALVQGKLNIDEYFWIWRISRGEKWHEVLIIVKGSRSRQLDCNLSPSIFQNNICNDDLLCSVIDSLIDFSCYFGTRRGFLPSSDYMFPTSSFYVPLDTVFDQIW